MEFKAKELGKISKELRSDREYDPKLSTWGTPTLNEEEAVKRKN